MNQKGMKILIILFIFIIAGFFVYKFDTINRNKENILESANYLMDSICDNDFDKIKQHIKKNDGTELSNKEIYNFLLNSGLYRLMFIDNNKSTLEYSAEVDFFDTNKGVLKFEFQALNGDLIFNEIYFINNGVNEYFITDNIKESNKEVNKYSFAKDLANGEKFGFDDELFNTNKFLAFKFTQDEKDELQIEIIEEAKEDVKIYTLNLLDEILEDKDGSYRYDWNEEITLVSIYSNSKDNTINNLHTWSTILLSSITLHALDEKTDWHLTINYYDYNTEELIKTEIIR